MKKWFPGKGIFEQKTTFWIVLICSCCLLILWIIPWSGGRAEGEAQIPTGSIATVTGTPVGAVAIVLQNEQGFANLRAGPNTLGYEIVGVLVIGQEVPALGRSPGGNWIQVSYPGAPNAVAWVFSDLVEIRGTLPVVQPPPTNTPWTTPTLDPTLEAQFPIDSAPTRLPTYTPPPELVLPTPAPAETTGMAQRVPMALIIIGLAVVGVFGLFISILQGR